MEVEDEGRDSDERWRERAGVEKERMGRGGEGNEERDKR